MSLTYDKFLQLTSGLDSEGLDIEVAELFSSATLQTATPVIVTARRSVSRLGGGETRGNILHPHA